MNKNKTKLECAQFVAQNDKAQLRAAQNETKTESADGALAAAACSAPDWSGTFFADFPEKSFTQDGKLKVRLNQNNPLILLGPDGQLAQLTPDNAKSLLPQCEVEFYQGEAVSPDIARQIWDEAEKYHRPPSASQIA